ncbi:MAG TPA: TetR/AcrR family transcriptional regulator [Leptospiraceae bacterium]|nr:TetR/AcrR family transcriptional regulator [Leptospiraceae bacterium]HMW08010.1 TetR/AcrR family transcriptional regulator [Leptospiraceae bacterium]HMX33636.1 TetR/AcrR family transcriptional regulator [Leptospiraceae bacterium]HMY33770.1 TetR/AcrR family transcriptional regulator [Leptospiraceae bacterium]HMZ64857.1 TetR/AcrR family transcriptional regulator [Leptospiraceae bacterium]
MKTKSGEKEKLREKIIDQSIKVIKKKGISGASVDTIMESLGLTSGALYSHFSGKDDLLALSIEKQINSLTDFVSTLIENDRKEGLKNFIKYYLSEKHVRDLENGCIFAALISEVAQGPQRIKTVFHAGLDKFYSALEKGLPNDYKDKSRTVQFIFSTMVGSLSIARTMKSGIERDDFLNNVLASVLQLLP